MPLGFFASIGDGGIVQNLRIEEVTITGTGLRAGSLAGELRSGGQVAGVGIVNADFSSTAINRNQSAHIHRVHRWTYRIW